MSDISEQEIQEITRRVLNQVLGASTQQPASNPQAPGGNPRPQAAGSTAKKLVVIGSDHGGFDMKEALKPEIGNLGYEVLDVGAHSKDAVDYPDFAHEVASLVGGDRAWRGIMIDGAGIGSCIVANKVPGVRAGMAYDYSSAVNSREHNDTNVLTLGAGLIGLNLAKQIVQVWLSTEYAGGRHQRRIDKILAVEAKYLKNS